jgi:ATP-binding protein involved in chromosome partitioning
MMPPSREEITAALGNVIDPELKKPVTELDMVRDVQIDGGRVVVTIALTVPGCPLRSSFEDQVAREVEPLDGVEEVAVAFDVMSPDERAALTAKLRGGVQGRSKGISVGKDTRVLAVASGKGGVGKSTLTVNLAAAFTELGQRTGILDADVYGHSIPHMLGIHQRPVIVDKMIVPPVKFLGPPRSIPSARPVGSDGGANKSAPPEDGVASDASVKLMSIGFFLDENAPVMWRGPMLHRALEQFLSEVHWGELDTLLVDMPPGTGDVSISLGQLLPRAEAIVVTTPQPAAQQVAVRAAQMAQKTGMRLVGAVENMTYLVGSGEELFGAGGGEALAEEIGAPLLGRIPLDPRLRECADEGEPLVTADPDSETSRAIREVAAAITASRRGFKPLPVLS